MIVEVSFAADQAEATGLPDSSDASDTDSLLAADVDGGAFGNGRRLCVGRVQW